MYTIKTQVPVGKSYKSKGWTLNRGDIVELFPVMRYENDYTLIIGEFSSFCRLKFNPRLFFKDEYLVNHLEKLYYEDPRERITLKIDVPENRLYKNFINKYNHFEEINYIDMDFTVGKSFVGGCGNISLQVLKSFVPLNEYAEPYDITVDGIRSKGSLNLLTRFYFNNRKLLTYLEELYENEPGQPVHGKLLLPKTKVVDKPKYCISTRHLMNEEKLENIIDWDEVESYVSVSYNPAFKKWIVEHKAIEDNAFIKSFPSKATALLDAIFYLKSNGLVKFE